MTEELWQLDKLEMVYKEIAKLEDLADQFTSITMDGYGIIYDFEQSGAYQRLRYIMSMKLLLRYFPNLVPVSTFCSYDSADECFLEIGGTILSNLESVYTMLGWNVKTIYFDDISSCEFSSNALKKKDEILQFLIDKFPCIRGKQWVYKCVVDLFKKQARHELEVQSVMLFSNDVVSEAWNRVPNEVRPLFEKLMEKVMFPISCYCTDYNFSKDDGSEFVMTFFCDENDCFSSADYHLRPEHIVYAALFDQLIKRYTVALS